MWRRFRVVCFSVVVIVILCVGVCFLFCSPRLERIISPFPPSLCPEGEHDYTAELEDGIEGSWLKKFLQIKLLLKKSFFPRKCWLEILFGSQKKGIPLRQNIQRFCLASGSVLSMIETTNIFWLFILTRQCFWNLFCYCFRILRMRKCLFQSEEIIAILISSSLPSDLKGLLVSMA